MTAIETFVTQLNEDYLRDPNNKVWNLSAKHRAINKGHSKVQSDLGRSSSSNENNDVRNTVVGSELYELPDDFVRFTLIRYDGKPLTKTTRQETRKMDEEVENGIPNRYYIYNGKLGLYPVPTEVKQLDLTYKEIESTISASQDSELPSICDEAIVLYASYKLYLWTRDANSASLFRQDYEDEINRLRYTLLYDDENMKFN